MFDAAIFDFLTLTRNHHEKTIEGDLFGAFVAAGAISKANSNDPKKSSLIRCARTDKGVHAAGNLISLKLIIEDPDIVQKINEKLTSQIRVFGIERTNGGFSAYQFCDSRIYEYLIPTHAFLPPHPRSFLGKKLVQLAEEANDMEAYQNRQREVSNFWEETEEQYIKPLLEQLDPSIRSTVFKALYESDVNHIYMDNLSDSLDQAGNEIQNCKYSRVDSGDGPDELATDSSMRQPSSSTTECLVHQPIKAEALGPAHPVKVNEEDVTHHQRAISDQSQNPSSKPTDSAPLGSTMQQPSGSKIEDAAQQLIKAEAVDPAQHFVHANEDVTQDPRDTSDQLQETIAKPTDPPSPDSAMQRPSDSKVEGLDQDLINAVTVDPAQQLIKAEAVDADQQLIKAEAVDSTQHAVSVKVDDKTQDQRDTFDQLQNTSAKPTNPSPLDIAIKNIRAECIAAKKAYRIHSERLARVRSALSLFLGSQNYHNYTVNKEFRNPSAKRFIKSFVVHDKPVLINGTEWLSLKVHGQSFMMHQIRKMVSMVALVVRCGCHEGRVQDSYMKEKMSIPKAPGLGLLLERPVFDTYNEKLVGQFGRERIDFGKHEKVMEEFKQREIYERIFREEESDSQFVPHIFLSLPKPSCLPFILATKEAKSPPKRFHTFFSSIDNLKSPVFLYLSSVGLPATRRPIIPAADETSTSHLVQPDPIDVQSSDEELSNEEDG